VCGVYKSQILLKSFHKGIEIERGKNLCRFTKIYQKSSPKGGENYLFIFSFGLKKEKIYQIY